MKDQFDEKLSQRIKEVFKNYEEPYNGATWEALKTKMAEKKNKKKRIFIYTRNIAAAFLFLALAYLLLPLSESRQEAEKTARTAPSELSLPEETEKNISENKEGDEPMLSATSAKEKDSATSYSESVKAPLTPQTTEEGNVMAQVEQNAAKSSITKPNKSPKIPGIVPATIPEVSTELPARKVTPLTPLLPEPLRMNYASEEKRSETILADASIEMPPSPYDSLPSLADLDYPTDSFSESRKNRKEEQSLAPRWGFELSPLFSYAPEAAESNLNLGGALTSEIPLTKNFSISSGIRLTQQSLDLQSSSSASSARELIRLSNATTSVNVDAQAVNLVSLDIPLNMRYNLNLKEDRALSFALGVSSLAYLQETYTSNFVETRFEPQIDAFSGAIESYEQVSIEREYENRRGAFNRFDPAGLLNVSVGFRYPLSERFHMVFEPYLKYPLRSLTSEELRLGSGGINLRFGFQ